VRAHTAIVLTGIIGCRSRFGETMSSTANRPEWNNFNENLIADLRANAGKPTSGPFLGRPVLILTTVGAKSGERRETPLVYSRDVDHLVVIASKGGAPTNPAWYHNLVAKPDVTLEVLGERFDARARVTEGEERDRLFRNQADEMPGFHEYQQKTTRRIPVVVLERATEDGQGKA
jgi:deazaflavin-dependent oxidoreductase (nitroreductase family)